MYLKFDLAGPVMTEWVNTIAFKRKILRYWPTKIVDSHKVFDKVFIWHEHAGTFDHPLLYKTLGVTKEKIEEDSKEYDGLMDVFLEMTPWFDDLFTTITDANLADLINEHLEVDKLYTAHIRFETINTGKRSLGSPQPPTTVTNSEILSAVAGGYTTLPDDNLVIDNHVLDADGDDDGTTINNIFLFAALADKYSTVFDRTFKVTGRTVVDLSTLPENYDPYAEGALISLATSIEIQVTYKRKTSAHDGIGTHMFTSIQDKIDAIQAHILKLQRDPFNEEGFNHTYVDPTKGILARQLFEIEELVNPLTSSDIFYVQSNAAGFGQNAIIKSTSYIKYDGVKDMTGRDFVKFFNKAFDTGYKKAKVSWVVKAINVIIVFVAAILAVVSGGQSLVVAAAIIGTGVAVQYAFAMFLEYTGNMAGAIYTKKMTTFLGNISKVLGYITFIYSMYTSYVSGFMSTVMSGIKKFTISTAFKVMNTVSSWVNSGLDLYNELTAPNYSNQLEAKEKLLADQEEEMGDLTSPKAMELIRFYFDTYQWAEVNAVSDNIPYMMTQGKIDIATSKYY